MTRVAVGVLYPDVGAVRIRAGITLLQVCRLTEAPPDQRGLAARPFTGRDAAAEHVGLCRRHETL
jgi:hypothetical protein